MSLCFVLMPFGKKPGPDGKTIDFDKVYELLIKPAIMNAGLVPLRADHEEAGGFIQKPMFEALLLCDFAVADLTNANANVFYELGIRHAARPWSTVPMMAQGGRLPIDVDALKTVFYAVGSDGLPDPGTMDATIGIVSGMLREARGGVLKDSPIYQLIDYMPQPKLDHEKADIFRHQVAYSQKMKDRLAEARASGSDAAGALKGIEEELGSNTNTESGVLIDLMLSYRSRELFPEMIALIEKMPQPLQQTVMVQEQYALALNRNKQPELAERVLLQVLEKRGPSSETYSILGRVYKDQWSAARAAGETFRARGVLDKAIGAYLKGFETDWRDAFPGVNAVTLMEVREPRDSRQADLLPVVRYAVERRVAKGTPDYWDFATLLELAFIAGDEERAGSALSDALAHVREPFETNTTARNLGLLLEAKERRGQAQLWMKDVVEALRKGA